MLDVLEQRPDLFHFILQMTKTLVHAVEEAAVVQAQKSSFEAGVTKEKARAAAALG